MQLHRDFQMPINVTVPSRIENGQLYSGSTGAPRLSDRSETQKKFSRSNPPLMRGNDKNQPHSLGYPSTFQPQAYPSTFQPQAYPSTFQPHREWPASPQHQWQQQQSPYQAGPQFNHGGYQPVPAAYGGGAPHVADPSGFSPAMYQMWQKQPQTRSLTEIAASAVGILHQAGVPTRIGGSLAARANGGIRNPGDIDLEVASTPDFEKAYRALSQLNTVVQMPDGTPVRLQGRPETYFPGKMGIVKLMGTYPGGEQRTIEADIVNENSYGLDPHIYSPWQRQTNPNNLPGNVLPGELVINCLSRHVFRPEVSAQKQDVQQIAALLRHAGLDPHNEIASGEVINALSSAFQPQHRAMAQQKLREIVYSMAVGQV